MFFNMRGLVLEYEREKIRERTVRGSREKARLKAIPEEQRRLVEGYRKGLYADFMMREDMELIQREQLHPIHRGG